MKRRTKIAVAGAAALALGGVGVGLSTGAVQAGGAGDDDAGEQPITGSAYDRAEQAALDHVGEGSVTGTEVDDEEGAYEVEVTRDDGTEVDVHLDEQFAVLGAEDESGDDEAGDDD